MRGDKEYLHFTIERALKRAPLSADQLALRLGRTRNGTSKALQQLQIAGRVERTGVGLAHDPYLWRLTLLPIDCCAG